MSRIVKLREALEAKPQLLLDLFASFNADPPRIAGPWMPHLPIGPCFQFRIHRKDIKGRTQVAIDRTASGRWMAYPTAYLQIDGSDKIFEAVDWGNFKTLDAVKTRVDVILNTHGVRIADGWFVDWGPWAQIPQPPPFPFLYARGPLDSPHQAYTRGTLPEAHSGLPVAVPPPQELPQEYTWAVLFDKTAYLAEGVCDTREKAQHACDQALVQLGFGTGLARTKCWDLDAGGTLEPSL